MSRPAKNRCAAPPATSVEAVVAGAFSGVKSAPVGAGGTTKSGPTAQADSAHKDNAAACDAPNPRATHALRTSASGTLRHCNGPDTTTSHFERDRVVIYYPVSQ